jgi:PAS domain S-box-containing protein
MFISLELKSYSIFPDSMLLVSTSWTYWMTISTAFSMSFLSIFFYRRANEKFEHELRESQGRFARVVETAQEGIVVCNDNGQVSYANPALAQRLGIPQSELTGRSVMDFISPRYRKIVQDNVLNLKRTEVEFIRPDGKRLLSWMSTSPLYEDRPGSKAHVGLILDITESREKQRLIDRQRSQMLSSAKLSALGEMAAGIAHEIYNPLTSIRLSIGLLKRFFSSANKDYDKAQKTAEEMETTIQRIVQIIEGLKAFSQEDRAAESVDVPLTKVIDDTLSLCRERFRVHGIDLTIPQVSRDLTIHARPIQISQVLLNLLNNSFHAVSNQRDRRVVIDFHVIPKTKMLEMSVTDNGSGIPAEIRDRIFQPFFTTKPAGVGTGLGLSISKGIIESHGGQFSFQSKRGKTTFSFTVPLGRGATQTGMAA